MDTRKALALLLTACTLFAGRPDDAPRSSSKPLAAVQTTAPAGASMPSSPNPAPPPDHLSLALGRDTIDLVKVATCSSRPALAHLGDEAFRRACASGNRELALFHLVLPNSLKGTRLRHHHGDSRFELPAPSLIYRMPTSPLHAFLVLAPGQAGSLEATTKDGQTATLELASRRDLLARMPLHWSPGSRDIHYHGLPSTSARRTSP